MALRTNSTWTRCKSVAAIAVLANVLLMLLLVGPPTWAPPGASSIEPTAPPGANVDTRPHRNAAVVHAPRPSSSSTHLARSDTAVAPPITDSPSGTPCLVSKVACVREGCTAGAALATCFDAEHAGTCQCPAPRCILTGRGSCVVSPFALSGAEPSRQTPRRDLHRVLSSLGLNVTAETPSIERGACASAPGDGGADAPSVRETTDPPDAQFVVADAAPATSVSPHRNPLRAATPTNMGTEGLACDPAAVPLASTVSDGDDGLIHFRGLCFRRRGRTAAAAPLRTRWTLEPIGHEAGGFEALDSFRRWLMPHPQELDAAASCVVATHTAVVVPLAYPVDNHMHVLHRVGSLIDVLTRHIGEDFRSRVVVVYVVLNADAYPRNANATFNAFATYAAALSDRWIVVEEGRPSDVANVRPFVCFDHVFVVRAQKAGPNMRRVLGHHMKTLNAERKAAALAAAEPERRALDGSTNVSFPMFGERHPQHREAASRIRHVIVNCFAPAMVDASTVARMRRPDGVRREYRPKLTVVWRSRSRRLAGMAALLPVIADHWVGKLGGSSDIRVVEHIRHSPHDLAARFAQTDVTVGFFGAGLVWGYLMPPGSVMVEVARNFGCTSAHRLQGWNASTRCEYSGDSYAFGLHHLAVVLPQGYGDPAGMAWEYVPAPLWKALLEAAVCRWKDGSPMDAKCAVPLDALFQRIGDEPHVTSLEHT